MLCTTAVRLRTVVCVSLFRFFWSYLVLSAFDRRPPLLYTYTQHQILTPSVISSCLPRLYPGSKRGSPSPECLWYTYLNITFFSAACLFGTITCSCDTRYDISAQQQTRYLLAPPRVLWYLNTSSAAVLLYVQGRLDVELCCTFW